MNYELLDHQLPASTRTSHVTSGQQVDSRSVSGVAGVTGAGNGSLERFLTSALAGILTLVFAWRLLIGSEEERPVTVDCTARRTHSAAAAATVEGGGVALLQQQQQQHVATGNKTQHLSASQKVGRINQEEQHNLARIHRGDSDAGEVVECQLPNCGNRKQQKHPFIGSAAAAAATAPLLSTNSCDSSATNSESTVYQECSDSWADDDYEQQQLEEQLELALAELSDTVSEFEVDIDDTAMSVSGHCEPVDTDYVTTSQTQGRCLSWSCSFPLALSTQAADVTVNNNNNNIKEREQEMGSSVDYPSTSCYSVVNSRPVVIVSAAAADNNNDDLTATGANSAIAADAGDDINNSMPTNTSPQPTSATSDVKNDETVDDDSEHEAASATWLSLFRSYLLSDAERYGFSVKHSDKSANNSAATQLSDDLLNDSLSTIAEECSIDLERVNGDVDSQYGDSPQHLETPCLPAEDELECCASNDVIAADFVSSVIDRLSDLANNSHVRFTDCDLPWIDDVTYEHPPVISESRDLQSQSKLAGCRALETALEMTSSRSPPKRDDANSEAEVAATVCTAQAHCTVVARYVAAARHPKISPPDVAADADILAKTEVTSRASDVSAYVAVALAAARAATAAVGDVTDRVRSLVVDADSMANSIELILNTHCIVCSENQDGGDDKKLREMELDDVTATFSNEQFGVDTRFQGQMVDYEGQNAADDARRSLRSNEDYTAILYDSDEDSPADQQPRHGRLTTDCLQKHETSSSTSQSKLWQSMWSPDSPDSPDTDSADSPNPDSPDSGKKQLEGDKSVHLCSQIDASSGGSLTSFMGTDGLQPEVELSGPTSASPVNYENYSQSPGTKRRSSRSSSTSSLQRNVSLPRDVTVDSASAGDINNHQLPEVCHDGGLQLAPRYHSRPAVSSSFENLVGSLLGFPPRTSTPDVTSLPHRQQRQRPSPTSSSVSRYSSSCRVTSLPVRGERQQAGSTSTASRLVGYGATVLPGLLSELVLEQLSAAGFGRMNTVDHTLTTPNRHRPSSVVPQQQQQQQRIKKAKQLFKSFHSCVDRHPQRKTTQNT